MVGFREVHGKGRVRGIAWKAQRWDEVTFFDWLFKKKNQSRGKSGISSVTGPTETTSRRVRRHALITPRSR